ncbi:MAG: peptide deformylase [Alphaproteobacteria bacterium]|jgi:peptide deformylase|nr:peptide deformylase [Rhodospirillaceae bacterium]MBT6509195.1 peptide deformylase [Rhodospirillaceae bacterium]MBT7648759.1 peptide deformylase [Rhodospirillaceae bacterium]MDG2480071.1 peptide deformylase [Alphaproteobacteria bacterium]
MAILKIARMGHPVLQHRAEEVSDPTAPPIRKLVMDMIETMHDANGRGLAAPQVHVPLRVVVFITPEEDEHAGVTAIVNPVLDLLTAERVEGWEGCLSVPGLQGVVPRAPKVRYSGVTPDGTPIDRTVEGFHAVVVQHEFDHLDGILYPQRMTNLGQLIFESEARWLHSEAEDEEE